MCIEERSDCITNATQEELYLKILLVSKKKKHQTHNPHPPKKPNEQTTIILWLEKATRQTKAFYTVTQK